MRARGVHVIVYHRYRFWRPRFWALLRRNHRKTLVCDGRIAFAGGLNIANDWVCARRRRRRLARRRRPGRRAGGRRHRGESSCAPGTAAPRSGRGSTRRAAPPGARRRRRALVVISNSELRDRFAIRRAALHALRESRAPGLPGQPLLRPRSRRAARAAAGGRARRRRPPAAAAGAATRPFSTWRRARCSDRCWRRAWHLAEPRRRPHARRCRSTTCSCRSAATTSTTGRWPTTSRWWSTSSTSAPRPT